MVVQVASRRHCKNLRRECGSSRLISIECQDEGIECQAEGSGFNEPGCVVHSIRQSLNVHLKLDVNQCAFKIECGCQVFCVQLGNKTSKASTSKITYLQIYDTIMTLIKS